MGENSAVTTKGRRHRPIAISWNAPISEPSLRDSGIRLIGNVPWGTHVCLFCETKQDLIESSLDYFRPAPAANEYCIWQISDPLRKTDALAALKQIPELDRWRRTGGFEILANPPGYPGRGRMDLDRVVSEYHARNVSALTRGFDGVRTCMNPPWRKFRLWRDINDYEQAIDKALSGQPAIVLCTYGLKGSWPADVLDVAHTHQCVIARRMGHWEFLNSSVTRLARKELRMFNEDVDQLPDRLRNEGLLTERERVVLGQIVKGASSKSVARALGISPRTVEFHRANTMQKLGARNTAELVRMALKGR